MRYPRVYIASHGSHVVVSDGDEVRSLCNGWQEPKDVFEEYARSVPLCDHSGEVECSACAAASQYVDA